jgi:hypothetical protein
VECLYDPYLDFGTPSYDGAEGLASLGMKRAKLFYFLAEDQRTGTNIHHN